MLRGWTSFRGYLRCVRRTCAENVGFGLSGGDINKHAHQLHQPRGRGSVGAVLRYSPRWRVSHGSPLGFGPRSYSPLTPAQGCKLCGHFAWRRCLALEVLEDKIPCRRSPAFERRHWSSSPITPLCDTSVHTVQNSVYSAIEFQLGVVVTEHVLVA